MADRAYGQYCGLARAAEIVGERWALLILRDLLVGPKRFTDLYRGLPGIPSNVLAARLSELERAGVVARHVLPRPARAIVYQLSEYGMELEDVVTRLGRWGAKTLAEPRPGEIITADSLIMAMRTTFRPEAARGHKAGYELRLGETVIHVCVNDGSVEAMAGPLPNADLVIETGPAIKALMAGEISPTQAVKAGSVRLTGNPKLLARFVEIFQI